MSFLATRNTDAERLMGLGQLGFLFALMLGHNGHISNIPLAIGGGLGLLGLAFKFANRNAKGEAL